MSSTSITNSTALIVDDDQSTCDVVAAILEQEGFKVITANSGEQALEYFGEYMFDIVFTDVCMDGISGLELLNRITNMDRSIKTVVMTAFSGYDVVLQALKGGAQDYIEKPIDDHDRVAAIARKAYAHAMLERDNAELLSKLKTSHTKLASANAQLVKLNEKLENLAITDSLTGLKNRRYIDQALNQEFARFKRYGGEFSIVVIDVDHFKQFNDSHGHNGGDIALQKLAAVLEENARATDLVGRYGGEEFFMLLSNTSEDGATVVANRVLEDMAAARIQFGQTTESITVSIGVTCADSRNKVKNAGDLFEQADAALFQAKKAGRNRVECHQHENQPPTQLPLTGTG